MGLIDLFIKPEPENKKGSQQGGKKSTAAPSNNRKESPKSAVVNTPNQAPKASEKKEEKAEPVAPVTYTSDLSSEVSIDVQKKLWATLQDRNIPGPDMMEVVTYSASMESLGLPLEKRYEAAFNVLKSQYPNFSKKALLNSVDVYIGYVKEELESGKRQFAEKRRYDVDNKMQEVTNLTNNRTLLQAQIEELKKRCDELSARIEETKTVAEKSDKEIAHNERIFENTINALVDKLQKDKEVMSNLNI